MKELKMNDNNLIRVDLSTLFPNMDIRRGTYFYNPTINRVWSEFNKMHMIGTCPKYSGRRYNLMTEVGSGRKSVSIPLQTIVFAYKAYAEGQRATVAVETAGKVATTKGWIIGSAAPNGEFSFSKTPKIHLTADSANTEIERLAKAHAGKTYVKLKVESYVQAGGVKWM